MYHTYVRRVPFSSRDKMSITRLTSEFGKHEREWKKINLVPLKDVLNEESPSKHIDPLKT
jgi:hypothetical protein